MLFADVEANNLLPGVTRIWCLAIAELEGPVDVYADQPGFRPLSEGIDRLKEADKVVFHNGMNYDFWVLNKFYPGTLRRDQILDSLILCRMSDPEHNHNLELIGERLGFPKGNFTDFSQWDIAMVPYVTRDVNILRRLWPTISAFYAENNQRKEGLRWSPVEMEHHVAYVLAKQEQHGFRFDVKAAQKLEGELRKEIEDLTYKLRESFPPIVHERWSEKTGKRLKDKIEIFNPGSRQQIAARLKAKYNWKPTAFTETGLPEVNEETLGRISQYPEVKLLLEYLRINKMLGQLADGKNAWLKLVRGTGYVHGAVNGIGCRTHRMSHFGPNMGQVDTDPRMRSLWLPDEGQVLVGCDAEGLELRGLGHYLFPYDNGAFIKAVTEGVKAEGTDAHSINMRIVGLKTRNGAKTLIYALIYGAGDPKLARIWVEDTGIKVKLLKAKGAEIRTALETGIVGFGKLVKKAKHHHKTFGKLRTLDGRWIRSAGEHSALNTLIQSGGAIIMKWALCLFDEIIEGPKYHNVPIHYCANVHDEVQLSVPKEYAEEIGQLFADCITKAGVELGVKCPLAGSYAVGENWQQTH